MAPINRYFRRHWQRVTLSILITLVFVANAGNIINLGFIQRMEYLAYDLRLNLTSPNSLDSRIIIVDVDERSLAEQGHWPWTRVKLAKLVENLFNVYGVEVVGFDFVFAEPEASETLVILNDFAKQKNSPDLTRAIEEIKPALQRDARFADSLRNRPVILGYYFNHDPAKPGKSGLLPEALLPREIADALAVNTPVAHGFGANLEILQSSAAGGGFFDSPLIDNDGVLRRHPLLQTYKGALYESLSLALARTFLDKPILVGDNNEVLFIGDHAIPVDEAMAALIPYRGSQGKFNYVSATDVIKRSVGNAKILKGNIALIGTTAPGLFDLLNTPVQKIFPGVEIHANMISGMLDGRFMHRPAYGKAAELPILLLIGIIFTLVAPLLGPIWVSLFTLFLLTSSISINLYFWTQDLLVIPLASSILLLLALYVFNMSYGFLKTDRDRRRVRNAFSTYLAPSLVKQLVEDPSRLRLGGESKEMTFLFTDIAGFTAFTEGREPSQLVDTLNEYLDAVCQIVMDKGGTIDKIVGDAVHAIFNAPVDQPDHAYRAVSCALEIDQFSTEYVRAKNTENIDFGHTRIGVNTGEAVVGNFGGHRRFDYTAHGDPINTAARLESVNKYFGTRICVSGTTAAQCPDIYFRPMGNLVLKGKTIGVDTFEPCTPALVNEDYFIQYRTAYELMKENIPEAKKLLVTLHEHYPDDPLIAFHLYRMENGESGVTIVMESK